MTLERIKIEDFAWKPCNDLKAAYRCGALKPHSKRFWVLVCVSVLCFLPSSEFNTHCGTRYCGFSPNKDTLVRFNCKSQNKNVIHNAIKVFIYFSGLKELPTDYSVPCLLTFVSWDNNE